MWKILWIWNNICALKKPHSCSSRKIWCICPVTRDIQFQEGPDVAEKFTCSCSPSLCLLITHLLLCHILTLKQRICILVLWQQLFTLCKAHSYPRFLLSLRFKRPYVFEKGQFKHNVWLSLIQELKIYHKLHWYSQICFFFFGEKYSPNVLLYTHAYVWWTAYTLLVLITEMFTISLTSFSTGKTKKGLFAEGTAGYT